MNHNFRALSLASPAVLYYTINVGFLLRVCMILCSNLVFFSCVLFAGHTDIYNRFVDTHTHTHSHEPSSRMVRLCRVACSDFDCCTFQVLGCSLAAPTWVVQRCLARPPMLGIVSPPTPCSLMFLFRRCKHSAGPSQKFISLAYINLTLVSLCFSLYGFA